ncbi:hypothetical protein DXG01_004383 [Tephrocybe rancida]|nr:hypothetical protein DXG01_004383 [Tephrocybe rancida]
MAKSKYPTRTEQCSTSGLGVAFTSPRKSRNKHKKSMLVVPFGHQQDVDRARAKFEELKKKTKAANLQEPESVEAQEPVETEVVECEESCDTINEPMHIDYEDPFPSQDFIDSTPRVHAPRRTLPTQSAKMLYSHWANALERLVDPLLEYILSSLGSIPERVVQLQSRCQGLGCCTTRMNIVLCLFQDYFKKLSVSWCDCQDFLQVLISNGLFPTTPLQPRIAVSIHLLDFYRALFEKSCNAIQAMASALNTFYIWQGFILLNKKGSPIQDAFRQGLGYASQWYNNLVIRLEKSVDAAIVAADAEIRQTYGDHVTQSTEDELITSDNDLVSRANPSVSLTSIAPSGTSLTHGECARVLQQRCPTCFGGRLFGRSLELEGGDIHVCVDGNFNHRHLRSAGDLPRFYEPAFILPKEYVDDVGHQIESLCKVQKPRQRKRVVPDEALDECEASYTAARGSNIKTNMERFDDGGLMALVCRHDIPIFLANIDTPGEQQKYAVAMLEHLFSLLPSHATVALLYDVGCILDRTLDTALVSLTEKASNAFGR